MVRRRGPKVPVRRRGPKVPLLLAKFHPHRCNNKGVWPQKLKFLLRFDQNVECAFFTKFAEFVPHFRDALAIKICLDLLEGLWSYGGFKLRVSGSPKYSVSPSGESMRQTPKRFRVARTCSRSSIIMPSLVGLGFHPPPGQTKTLSFFVCLSVRHAFERQRLCARVRYEGVGVQKRF